MQPSGKEDLLDFLWHVVRAHPIKHREKVITLLNSSIDGKKEGKVSFD